MKKLSELSTEWKKIRKQEVYQSFMEDGVFSKIYDTAASDARMGYDYSVIPLSKVKGLDPCDPIHVYTVNKYFDDCLVEFLMEGIDYTHIKITFNPVPDFAI